MIIFKWWTSRQNWMCLAWDNNSPMKSLLDLLVAMVATNLKYLHFQCNFLDEPLDLKYERNELHAKLMWSPLGVTYIARFALHSYFNECQKNEIYFLIQSVPKPYKQPKKPTHKIDATDKIRLRLSVILVWNFGRGQTWQSSKYEP